MSSDFGMYRGNIAEIKRHKERLDKWWGGEKNRLKQIGKTCSDCLNQHCKEDCEGKDERIS